MNSTERFWSLMRWVKRYKLDKSIKRHNRQPIAYKDDIDEIKTSIKFINKKLEIYDDKTN